MKQSILYSMAKLSESLLYLEVLRAKNIKNIELRDLIQKQPYSERYSFFITHNGINCTYAQIIKRHYETVPVGQSKFYENVKPEYNTLSCKELLVKLLDTELQDEEEIKLRDIVCRE